MKNCLIIGGGLAGLSSAVFLSQEEYKVELIESSPKLGGRTYSFIDRKNGTEIDNGQHILMGSYLNTFELLKIIGTESIPIYQSKLEAEYIKKGGLFYHLKSPHKLYPINLIQALLNFEAVSFSERVNILKFFAKHVFSDKTSISNKPVKEYLSENRQSKNVIDSVWELLTVSALNTKISEASTKMFLSVLKKMFFEGNKSSTIVLPKLPLSKLFIEPTEEYFKKNNIKYSCSEAVVSLFSQNGVINGVQTNKRELFGYDNIILAIPSHSVNKLDSISPIISSNSYDLENSPIITIHIWINKKLHFNKFAGLINSKIHWVFDNESHISVVISAADEFIDKENSEIFEFVLKELEVYLPYFSKNNITDYRVMKEKRATFKCNYHNEELRSNIKSNFKNLVLAGDWTNTKLPGTIEGAILSGKAAVEEILKK